MAKLIHFVKQLSDFGITNFTDKCCTNGFYSTLALITPIGYELKISRPSNILVECNPLRLMFTAGNRRVVQQQQTHISHLPLHSPSPPPSHIPPSLFLSLSRGLMFRPEALAPVSVCCNRSVPSQIGEERENQPHVFCSLLGYGEKYAENVFNEKLNK